MLVGPLAEGGERDTEGPGVGGSGRLADLVLPFLRDTERRHTGGHGFVRGHVTAIDLLTLISGILLAVQGISPA